MNATDLNSFPMLKRVESKKKIFFQTLFFLLLYSLISGIYKIFDNQLMMILNIPVLFFLFRIKNPTPNRLLFLKGYDVFFILFLFYLAIQSIFTVLNPKTNLTGLIIGIFLDLIPFIGFFYSRRILFDSFAKILLFIAVVHLTIGIILYPPLGLSGLFGPLANIFTDKFDNRMYSLSGSLAFGNLMMYACIISINYKKILLPILLIGLIFAAQRGAWIGFIFSILLYIYQILKNTSLEKTIKNIGSIIIICIALIIVTNLFTFDFSFINYRFSSISVAVSGRSNQWADALTNFVNNPLGVGIGQSGHIAGRFTHDNTYLFIADGDFFRVISEYGLGGLLFYSFFFVFTLFLLLFTHLNSKRKVTVISLIGASSIQMIGSNIGEFYFNNFIFWTFVGYYFEIANEKFNIYTYPEQKNEFRMRFSKLTFLN